MAKDLIRVKGHGKLSQVRDQLHQPEYYSKIFLSKLVSQDLLNQAQQRPLTMTFDEQIRASNYFISFYGKLWFSAENNKISMVLKLEDFLFQYPWGNTAKETDFQMFYADIKNHPIKAQVWQTIEKAVVENFIINDFRQAFSDEKKQAIDYMNTLGFSEDLPEIQNKEINRFLKAFAQRIETLKERYTQKIKQLDY